MFIFFFPHLLQLHLNPVHAVVQLRPSMEYLSSGGAKRRNNVTGDVEPAVKLEVSKEESVGSLRKLVNCFIYL